MWHARIPLIVVYSIGKQWPCICPTVDRWRHTYTGPLKRGSTSTYNGQNEHTPAAVQVDLPVVFQ